MRNHVITVDDSCGLTFRPYQLLRLIKLFEPLGPSAPGILAPATNTWGVWVGATGADNYFGGAVNIGNSTQLVSNDSIALEVGNNKAVRFANMSSGAIGGLTPLPGMMVFNTDSAQMQYYNGTSWVSF